MLKIKKNPLHLKTPEVHGYFNEEDMQTYRLYCSEIHNGNIAEIGSYEGLSLWSIKDIIKNNNIKSWSIDNIARPELVNNTKKWGINFIHKSSIDAAKDFENNFFDLVFIDAEHKYESLKNDIKSWLPKLKINGILMGHDYSSLYPGVVNAVNELLQGFYTDNGRIWIYKKL